MSNDDRPSMQFIFTRYLMDFNDNYWFRIISLIQFVKTINCIVAQLRRRSASHNETILILIAARVNNYR